MSTILPAGTYAHPLTGEPLTLGEWTSDRHGHTRAWTHDPDRFGDLAAGLRPGLGTWMAWRPSPLRDDESTLILASGSDGTRDDADRALSAWLAPARTSAGAATPAAPAPYTIRHTERGLDEVIARDVTFAHLEYMADNHVWMRLDRPDGAVVVNLTARGKIEGLAEWEERLEPAAPVPDVRRLEALAAAAPTDPDGIRDPLDAQLDVLRTAVPALIAEVRRLRALVAHQNDDVVGTRGALVAVQREVEALRAGVAEAEDALSELDHRGDYDDIRARLRALVEGA